MCVHFNFRHSGYLLVALSVSTILLAVVPVSLLVVFASLVALVSIFGSAVATVRVVLFAVLLIMVVFLVMPVACKTNFMRQSKNVKRIVYCVTASVMF